jgi:HAMP domain-containing protein
LARAVKAAMRYEADAIAAHAALQEAAAARDRQRLSRELRELVSRYPNLVSLTVQNGDLTVSADRGRPLDAAREYRLEVVRPLGGRPAGPLLAEEPDQTEGPELVAVFGAERARFDQLDEMSQFVDFFRKIAERRKADESSYVYAFAALLGITILAAIGVGTLMARSVSQRIARLAEATQRVGAGDLDIRVPERGSDEIADLARAFNRMLSEVETSRARVEYLRRIGAWQEMARRLAHEIKNPLTPIQLAVQEIHRRYSGADGTYRKLLDSTLEMVEDEVGTLRRLVTEFSGFARLPQAELKLGDLGPDILGGPGTIPLRPNGTARSRGRRAGLESAGPCHAGLSGSTDAAASVDQSGGQRSAGDHPHRLLRQGRGGTRPGRRLLYPRHR